MKNIIRYILTVCSVAMLCSCVEDDLTTYSSNDSIYFSPSVEGAVATNPFDSLFYSLGLVPNSFTDSLISIPVKVMGKVVDYDREFSVELSAGSTAVEGTNFEFANDLLIPAGQIAAEVQIRLFKTPDILEDTVNIGLRLLSNEHFGTDMQNDFNELGEKELSHIDFDVYLTAVITQPRYWFAPYLGDFSVKKILLMAEILDIDPLIFTKPGISVSQMNYFGVVMKRYLESQKAAGNTIYEEDGSEMVMGPYI